MAALPQTSMEAGLQFETHSRTQSSEKFKIHILSKRLQISLY